MQISFIINLQGGDLLYQARILDKNRQLKAILPGVRWSYTRRINTATGIEIHIPRETVDEQIPEGHALYGFFAPSQPFVVQAKPQRAKQNKAQYAEIAAYVQIYKGGTLKASGKITGRTLGQVVTVAAMTEEVLLESSQTPAQYGKVWDGWDLADVARDVLNGWQSIRVKDQSQWQSYMVDSSNVDLTTNPGHVMLAKRSNGRYYDSGYITLLFDKGEIPDFKGWDRVRWSADSEDPVKTSIQISNNGTSFSAPFDGGIPEEVGYYIGGDHDQVWVRINLSTTDTESEDANEIPTGVTPTVFAVELIARTKGDLVAGNIPAVAGVTVKGLSADHASAFRVLVDACEQVGWEFNVWNGALNAAEALGVDRTKDFVFRAGSNIEIQTLGDSDGEMVNALTAYGPGSGINRLEITLRDEASIVEFGAYPLAMQFDVEKLDELQQKAQEFLDENNSPKMQFEIAVAFDHEKEPDYGLGDRVRVADPETGIVTTTRIMAESREYNEDGLIVNLELGKADFTLSEAIAGKQKPVKPLDPLQPSGVYARGVIAGLVVGCAVPKIDWAYTECHLSTASGFTPSSSTLRTKGKQNRFDIMELTPGVRYYAKLIHVDDTGRKSEPSIEASAVALDVLGAIPDNSIPADKWEGTDTPPETPTGLVVYPGYKLHVVKWNPSTRAAKYLLEYNTGTAWVAIDVGNTTQYPHSGLDINLAYRYRVTAIGLTGKASVPSGVVVAGNPGTIAVSEEIIANFDWEGWLEGSSPFKDLEGEVISQGGDISAVAQTASQISQTVADIEGGVTTLGTTLQQTAQMIALRLDGSDIITPAGLVVGQVDGQGYITLHASAVNLISDNYRLTNTGLEVEDDNGVVRVRIGRLS